MSVLADPATASVPQGPNGSRLPRAKTIRYNPSPAELQELTSRMPQARRTSFGNYNVQTKVTSRSAGSTYIATDDPSITDKKVIDRAEYARVAKLQDAYIAEQAMVIIDGYIGNDLEHRVARPPVHRRGERQRGGHAAAALLRARCIRHPGRGMAAGAGDDLHAQPADARLPRRAPHRGRPRRRDQPGLQLRLLRRVEEGRPADVERAHPGKGRPRHARRMQGHPDRRRARRPSLIIGLSGTGKTTTTFTRQNGSPAGPGRLHRPLPGRPGGRHRERLLREDVRPRSRPTSRRSTARWSSPMRTSRTSRRPMSTAPVDFFDTSYTKNGRATFPMSSLGIWRDPREIGPVTHLLILNRNDNIVPGVARLTREQAAAYFMLGETKGTSAGGAAEEGKALRVPGTNPFFPLRDEEQANRFHDLMDTADFEVFLLNTGRVGGGDDDADSKKMTIEDSSAIVKGIVEGHDRVGAGPGLRLRGRDVGARHRRRGEAPAAPPLRAPGAVRRPRRDRRALQARAGRVPGPLSRPQAGDRRRRPLDRGRRAPPEASVRVLVLERRLHRDVDVALEGARDGAAVAGRLRDRVELVLVHPGHHADHVELRAGDGP